MLWNITNTCVKSIAWKHDITEEGLTNHDQDVKLEITGDNEPIRKTSCIEVGADIAKSNESGTDSQASVDRKNSEEQALQSKGKSFSKESDVDSGCGSSYHEMRATESQLTHAQLSITTLANCRDKGVQGNDLEPCEKHGPEIISNEKLSQEFRKSEVDPDSFEELIKLAKDGMSTLARKRVDGDKNNKKTASCCFQANTGNDNVADTQDSGICLDARKVEVKCASSTSLCLEQNTNMGEILHYTANGALPSNSASSATCVVEIPTIVVESESGTVDNVLETKRENAVQARCSQTQDPECYNTQVNIEKCSQGGPQNEPSLTYTDEDELRSKQKAVSFDEPNDPRLAIEQRFVNNGVTERPKSLVLPSASTNETNGVMHGLKVQSLETLNLPNSHVESAKHHGRIRSFSATIRRKISFRERISSDDMDIEKQAPGQDPVVPNSPKIKGFRSFRMNRKKKNKPLKNEELSQSTGCLDGSNSNKYLSTFDKIFHEHTGSMMFSDVPFTIPEISEQWHG